MSERSPRLLFIPVSGEFGRGEYARSLAIAQGAAGRWPNASLLFILSRAAPYAATTPLPTTLLDSSPTFHTPEVVEIINNWRPDVVVFDNAGRTAQIRAAKRAGAWVVYISSRRRQRNKAFRLRWMRLIDEHWIAYPQFIAGELTTLERLKLRFMRRPEVRYLDVILARDARSADAARESAAARLGCTAGAYTLVVPGGGTGHPGAADAVDQFLDAARSLAAAGIETVFVGRAGAAASGGARLRMLGSLPQSELAELMRDAQLVMANGGSTLLQAIGSGKACVAVPIAGDQGERIRRCAQAGVAVSVPLDAQAMLQAATALLGDPPRLQALAARAAALGLADGVEVALRALATRLDPQ